jgi:hypothetical protein
MFNILPIVPRDFRAALCTYTHIHSVKRCRWLYSLEVVQFSDLKGQAKYFRIVYERNCCFIHETARGVSVLTALQLWFTVFSRRCNSFLKLRMSSGHLMYTNRWICPHIRLKEYRECGSIALLFLNLGNRWRGVISLMTQPLYPGERAPGTHSIGGWVGPRTGLDVWGNKSLYRLWGFEPRIIQSVAQ